MALPPARLPRALIRSLACNQAGNPGLINTEAPVYLQLILDGLYLNYEWPFLFVTATVNLGGPSFALPADFLETQGDNALMIQSINGAPTKSRVLELDKDTYTASLIANLNPGTPQQWYADRTLGIGLLFPAGTGQVILAELSYKSYPPSQLDTTGQPLVTEPIDIPVFPYSWYLVKALAAMIATYEGDARASQWMSDADSMMATLRQSALPLRSMMTTIPLAASRFGPTFKGD